MMYFLLLQLTLPNFTVTPGVARGLTVQTICATRWGLDSRHVDEKKKQEVAKLYKIPRSSVKPYGQGPCCEFDHLIPRELGGADVVANLWPQVWVDAKKKDVLENFLHREVCAGRMNLAAAQHAILTQWAKQ